MSYIQANQFHIPAQVKEVILGHVFESLYRDEESLVSAACVCSLWQHLVERHTLEQIRLRASRRNDDLAMFAQIFQTTRRRIQCLRWIDLDFDFRATNYDLPMFVRGTELRGAMFAMLEMDRITPPLLCYQQFASQMMQDNIRMTGLITQLFRQLSTWSQDDSRQGGIMLRLIAETPTY